MRHVIVGAGQAGVSAAEALREGGGPDDQVLVIGAETEPPYDHPPLSKDYLRGETAREKVHLKPAGWYEEAGVELRLGRRVAAIDPAAHELAMEDGSSVGYDRLLIATGGRPRRLPVPGASREWVLTLRSVDDSDRIRAAAQAAGRTVVVGGGFIGVEVAASLRMIGIDIDLVLLEDRVLEGPLGTAMADRLTALLRERGVRVHTATGVASFEGEGDEGPLSAVALEGAEPIEASVAITGAGIEPATELAEGAGLELDLGGIACDQGFRTSAPDVFAAGDVAAVRSTIAGRRLRIEHWAEALNQGKLAGAAMLGRDPVYDRVPYFFSDIFDSGVEYVGVGGRIEEEIAHPRGDGLVSYHLAGGRLIGVATLDAEGVLDQARDLLRAGAGREDVPTS